jgi:hypothetical protein
MTISLETIGALCVIAAIVGGGLEALNIKIPVIGSLPRQILLAVAGVFLVGIGVFKPGSTLPSVPSPTVLATSAAAEARRSPTAVPAAQAPAKSLPPAATSAAATPVTGVVTPPPPAGEVDIKQPLSTPPTIACSGGSTPTRTAIGNVDISLAGVERQADGRVVWHVSFLNHNAAPVQLSLDSASYVLTNTGTKYVTRQIGDATVAIQEQKAFDVVSEAQDIPDGNYRLFFVVKTFTLVGSGPCADLAWSSSDVTLPH